VQVSTIPIVLLNISFLYVLFKETNYEGIPEHLLREEAPARPAAAAATPATSAPASSGSSAPAAGGAVNLFEQAAAAANAPRQASGAAGASSAEGMAGLEFLRQSPQFTQLRQLVQSNPQMLQPILQQLAQTNPELMQRINENPDAFLEMLHGDEDEEEGAAPGAGGSQYISVTPAEADAIARVRFLAKWTYQT
jgi:UV excision repair protein RAD23